MKCPNCNTSVPNTWDKCRCGYNLKGGGAVVKPIYKKNAEAAKQIEQRKKALERTSRQHSEVTGRQSGNATQILDTESLVAKQKAQMQREGRSPSSRKTDTDATQIIDSESLVARQKAEMLKASEAIRRRNKDSDATQILDITETPIDMISPGLQRPPEPARPTINTQAQQASVDAGIREEAVPTGPVRKLIFHGSYGKYFLIFLINRLLAIPTLGLYYFWGKVKERRYLHNQSSFEGDNFEYHARGLELLIGYIKVSIVFVAANSVQYIQMVNPSDILTYISLGVFFLIWMFVYPAIVVITVRFRYSRTSWRGVRFSFRGRIKEYIKIYVVGIILTFFTFGIYGHFLHQKSREFLVRNAYFGDTKFDYTGDGWPLFRNYLKVWMMFVIVTAAVVFLTYSGSESFKSGDRGLNSYVNAFSFLLYIIPAVYWLRFAAQRHRYHWANTIFSTLKFDLKMTDWNYCKLKIVNFIMLIFTLTLSTPFNEIRDIQRMFDDLHIHGDVDFNTIIQDARSPSAVGEAVEDALDLDFMGMEIGL
ncbi:MAG: DUF898 domain-containing protein [Candidatus Dadabacteria bacterium]|nr:DUF898 domain-containing protein [Candidatus Dadabacteria bacterium]NIS07973.1 DUF898 domain-containing protein [Candidatus Dadabacteria bacterium]NIV43094.1 DUF898 family protein [Candidatus Dadabacteria bacterium]NIX14931.1 DUF898 family protein [Candidatus Dadabacteria bacterium]NIY21557.1 DUF898 family protein [Candidatus Dadabacteria bacterium]